LQPYGAQLLKKDLILHEQRKKERYHEAGTIINIGSVMAGGTAGFLTKTMIADEAALTAITIGTIMGISKNIYGVNGLTEAAASVLVGKFLGLRLATAALKVAPVVGEFANAGSAVALHQLCGNAFVNWYEHQIDKGEKPSMPQEFKFFVAAVGLADAFFGEGHHGEAQFDEARYDEYLKHHAPMAGLHPVPEQDSLHHFLSTPSMIDAVARLGDVSVTTVQAIQTLSKFKELKPDEFANVVSDIKNLPCTQDITFFQMYYYQAYGRLQRLLDKRDVELEFNLIERYGHRPGWSP
jgi:uncharacterized protein (DUF697 family)